MQITSQADMAGILRIGRIAGMTLKKMQAAVRPGITTAELDAIGANLLTAEGAKSAPIISYKYPGFTCISLNDEAAHGIPSVDRVVKEGDLINIDVSAELDGYFADTGASMGVGQISSQAEKLLIAGRASLEKAIETAVAGVSIADFGRTMEVFIRKQGFQVIKDLPGHGVGRKLHEPPSVPNFFKKENLKVKFEQGMVLTLEPFVSVRAQHVDTLKDGWTLRSKDRSLVVQFEHTVIITKGRPLLVTQVD